MSYRCGPTAVGSRASWAPGPLERGPLERAPVAPRPLSTAYDRIFSAFDRTNAFQCVQRESSERTVAHADVVVNRRASISLEHADCALAAQPVADDDQWLARAAAAQQRQLYPLQEDLAEWINNTIGTTHVTGENFLSALDNGAELCLLAAAIHERAREAIDQGLVVGPVPLLRGRCWQRAARRSFFSRDNTENFITFCRELGVHDNLLFESDDLVLHQQPRQVVVCLLEVARLATRYGLEPPGLVQLEREIDREELDHANTWQYQGNDKSAVEAPSTSPDPNEGPLVDNADTESTKSGGTVGSADSDVPLRPTNELDKRVQLVTRLLERGCRCGAGKCSKLLKVKKVGEGRYNIAGRNVFIRLLKGRHMMVRVGGGWDTLEHFLSRHEPCQVRLVAPARRPGATHDRISPTSSKASLAPTHSRTLSPVESKERASSSGNISPVDAHLNDRPASSSGKISPIERSAPIGGKISPVDARLKGRSASTSGKISPVDAPNERRVSVGGKTSPVERSTTIVGKASSVDARLKERQASVSGKMSPVDARPKGRSASIGGKISPINVSANKVDRTSPISNSRRSSTPVKLTSKSRAGLTLPLKTDSDRPVVRRKQSAPSFSTPTTPRTPNRPAPINAPKKSRSMSLALNADKKFCGTERLNQGQNRRNSLATGIKSHSLASTPVESKKGLTNGFNERTTMNPSVVKKTRSMSLAHPIEFKPLSNKSISVNITGPMTQAAIEESIRLSLAATLVDCDGPKKPFLHIKAKYRSPPPREVPPR